MLDLLQKCEVCGGLLDEEDLFCANCGTGVPERDEQSQLATQQTTTHNFQCDGCGASMGYSAESRSLRCPFCGSEELTQQAARKTLAAQRVVPFSLTQDAALAKLKSFLGSSFWHPADLSRAAAVTEMRQVYVPYWVFSAETHTYWTADSGNTPFGARGNWVPVSGEHRGSYRGLLVGASGALTPAETEAICPFDLAHAAAPEEVDFRDVAQEQFTVQRKYARPLARSGLEASEAQACARRYLAGRHRNLKVNVRIEQLRSDPVLLPLWIMAYRYKQELFRFVVNGQTGKATGRAPFSKLKAVLVAAFVIAVVVVAFIVAGVLAAN